MTVAPVAPLTKDAIVDLTIGLLGTYLDEEPGALRQRLLNDGPNMPIDSLDLFDVLSDVRQATGLHLPAKKCRRDTLRSVDAFAAFVMAEAAAR